MTASRNAGKILLPGANCLGIFDSPLSGLFVDAEDYYFAFAKAARAAKRYILIAGWQFDSEVRLVRPESVSEDLPEAKSMLSFLNYLCQQNPDLEVFILAWDYSAVFALEREWFQSLVFQWKTPPQVHFRFDAAHAVAASHHQKFVVIDGAAAFAGGMDICANRWDDRAHRAKNSLRVTPSGRAFGPYHDIQAFVSGPAAAALAEIFRARWTGSGGAEVELPEVPMSGVLPVDPPLLIELNKVAISRTQARTLVPVQDPVREIRRLYIDAITAAEVSIYMENQYFSSQAVYEALLKRMSETSRSRLEIVMIFPKSLSGVIEGLTMGLAQARMFASLKEAASRLGHSLGLYYPASRSSSGTVPVYVHSKILIVDDRFLTVGSANTTNRSMGLDTELNLSWETEAIAGEVLSYSIHQVRTDLLREHTRLQGEESRGLVEVYGLVRFLDSVAESGKSCLLRLEAHDFLKGNRWLKDIPAEELAIDPEAPVVEEDIFEVIAHDKSGRFARMIMVFNRLLGREEFMPSRIAGGQAGRKGRRRARRLSLLGKTVIIIAFLFLFIAVTIAVLLI